MTFNQINANRRVACLNEPANFIQIKRTIIKLCGQTDGRTRRTPDWFYLFALAELKILKFANSKTEHAVRELLAIFTVFKIVILKACTKRPNWT